MSDNRISRINIWLITGLLILGCALPSAAAPTQAPVSQSSEMLGTSVVQTAEVAQTKTALVLPSPTFTPTITRTPTATHTPTPTFIFSIFTATSIPSETSIVPLSSGGTPNPGVSDEGYKFTGKEWTCTILAKYPGKGAIIKQGQTIIAYWTVLNTGTKTWTNNGVDFLYTGGLRMDGRKIQDLAISTASGNKITLKIQLTAPKREDTFSTIWTLKVGNRTFCPMKVTFDVQ